MEDPASNEVNNIMLPRTFFFGQVDSTCVTRAHIGSRDSIKAALRLGVTASQILRFLHVHAHPMLRNSNSGDVPLVPANVRDQILLWDRERRRVVMDEVRIFIQ